MTIFIAFGRFSVGTTCVSRMDGSAVRQRRERQPAGQLAPSAAEPMIVVFSGKNVCIRFKITVKKYDLFLLESMLT